MTRAKKQTVYDIYLNELVLYGGLAVPRHEVMKDLERSWSSLPGSPPQNKWYRDIVWRAMERTLRDDTDVPRGMFVDGELVPVPVTTTMP